MVHLEFIESKKKKKNSDELKLRRKYTKLSKVLTPYPVV